MNLTHSTDCTGMSIQDLQPSTSSREVNHATPKVFGKAFATLSLVLIMLMASNVSFAQSAQEIADAKEAQIKFDEKVRSTLKENAQTIQFMENKGQIFSHDIDGRRLSALIPRIERAGIRSLNEGDKVSFVLEDDRKGRGKQAGSIELA